MDLQEVARRVMAQGPNRVMINAEQEAVGWGRALKEHGISAEVIFIRHDGWTLGAPKHLAA